MSRVDMTKEAAEQVLELPRRYTKAELRRAYTDLARQYHPDAAGNRHFDPALAQSRMVEANKAYELLRQQFAHDSDRVVEREFVSTAQTFASVDWDTEWEDVGGTDDPWDFAGDFDTTPAPEKVPLSPRSVLLGPVVPRIVFIALFAWIWWRNFPLLLHNMASFVPSGGWTLMDVARLVSAMVYPTYLLVYEALSGNVSCFVREVLNGIVSWITGRYVDLRPKSSSYGCALYKLLKNQVYALLLAPIVLYLVAACVHENVVMVKVALGVVALVLGIDTLAACVRGGFVNVWASSLAERVEAQYLLLRARLLKRCGQWSDGKRD